MLVSLGGVVANIATAVGPALATSNTPMSQLAVEQWIQSAIEFKSHGPRGRGTRSIMASAVDKSVILQNADGNLTFERIRALVMGHDV
jgi:hypothetical protein